MTMIAPAAAAALRSALGPAAYKAISWAARNPGTTRAAAGAAYRGAKYVMKSRKRRRTDDVVGNKRRSNTYGSAGKIAMYNSRTAASTRHAVKITRKKRKPKKTIKVGRKLRYKIKKVVDGLDQVTGTHIYSARPMTLVQNNDNRKTWVMYPGFGTISGAFPGFAASGEVYSWNLVVDAASKLFNQKAAIEYPAIGDVNNFTSRTLEVDIDYCKVKFWIKNNSERNVRLACFKCTSTSKNGGTYGPLELFKLAATNNIASTTVNNQMTVTDINDQAGTTVWRNSPQFFDEWRDNWRVEKTEWLLAPGQTDYYTFTVDKDKVSGTKNYIEGVYQPFHKGSIYCMWSIIGDIINTGNVINDPGVAGYFRSPDVTGSPQRCVIIECERTMKIALPEQTGFTIPSPVTSGNPAPLNNRRSNTFYEEYYPTLPGSPLYQRVDEQSPYDRFSS